MNALCAQRQKIFFRGSLWFSACSVLEPGDATCTHRTYVAQTLYPGRHAAAATAVDRIAGHALAVGRVQVIVPLVTKCEWGAAQTAITGSQVAKGARYTGTGPPFP